MGFISLWNWIPTPLAASTFIKQQIIVVPKRVFCILFV